MRRSYLKRFLVFQVATLLLATPAALTMTQTFSAETIEQSKQNDSLGNITVQDTVFDSGEITWTLSMKKAASETDRQLQFIIADPSFLIGIKDLSVEDTELTSKPNGEYLVGENDKSAQEHIIEIKTKTTSEKTAYDLQVAGSLIDGEKQFFLTEPNIQTFSVTLPAETSSDSEPNSTVDSQLSDTSESAVSSESESSKPADSSASDSEKNSTSDSVENSENQQVIGRGLGTGNPIIPKGAIQVDGVFGDVNTQLRDSKATSGNSGVRPGDPNQNNGMPYSEVVISGTQNAVSIWSNEKYRMDFSKSFTGRTYINFGDNSKDADGVAFVMHNDSNTLKAITSANETSDGQNLGVYGGTNAFGSSLWPTTPESFAVKKSVAVEFDLYTNGSGKSQYDKKDQDTPHMAYAFPSNLQYSYRSNNINDETWTGGLVNSKARIYHKGKRTLNGVIGDNVRDSTWYEFRYDFDAAAQTFTYYMKNPITGAQTTPVSIPYEDMKNELDLANNDNKAYWGFTGANGSANGQVKFAFTQVPVDLNAYVQNDVVSDNASVVDEGNHDEYSPDLPAAKPGEKVTLKTIFKVTEGEVGLNVTNWSSSLDHELFDVSKGITDVKATIGDKVVSGQAVENGTGDVSVTFEGLAVLLGQEAVLEYTVQLKEKYSAPTIKTAFSSQITTTEIGNNTSEVFPSHEVPFWIVAEHPTNLSWKSDAALIEKAEDKDRSEISETGYQSSFYWQDSDKGDKLQFYVKKDGEVVQKLPEITSSGTADYIEAALTIPANKIAYGNNQYTVEVYRLSKDSAEIKEAATLTLNLNISGKLAFEAAPDNLKWTDRLSGETKGELKRDTGNVINLSVLDSREGENHWSVGVTAVANKNSLFDLVWKENSSEEARVISDDSVLAMDSANSTLEGYVFTKSWDESTGVLLLSEDHLKVGDHSEQINVKWQLYDTEQPE